MNIEDSAAFVVVDNDNALNGSNFLIEGKHLLNKDVGLKEISQSLKLPEGMGQNYDSLDECLQPDFWPELKEMRIYIRDARDFREKADPQFRDSLVGLLNDAFDAWSEERQSRAAFQVFLRIQLQISTPQA